MTAPASPEPGTIPPTQKSEINVSESKVIDAREFAESVVQTLSPEDVATRLWDYDPATSAEIIGRQDPLTALKILDALTPERRSDVLKAASRDNLDTWNRNATYPEETVGRLMTTPAGVFPPSLTVAQAIEELRLLVRQTMITYVYVVEPLPTDPDKAPTPGCLGKLIGVVVMRDMLFARPEQKLSEIMLRNPFSLNPQMSLADAMKEVITRHYPVYPVCESNGALVGLVRGEILFQLQVLESTAQMGTTVGVEKEERLSSPMFRSLTFRHPWLQFNLFTAFLAAAVVTYFQDTISKLLLLATFLPVLSGVTGNTGCQTLAVVLRGMALGEVDDTSTRKLVIKETLLGFCNGFLVGIVAAIAVMVLAWMQSDHNGKLLAVAILGSMTISCGISGFVGSVLPILLRRVGADPATAASIFISTASDVCSMSIFLGLAKLMLYLSGAQI
ncbi:MAG: magnesium transporter [Candidatus Methylacidiphilales bacterium]|nr:magnesium transporter [Candidatus Methylacidiphilales bacterium]